MNNKKDSRKKCYKVDIDYMEKLSDLDKEWIMAYNQLEMYNNTKPLNKLGVQVPKEQLKDIIHENKMNRTDIFKLSNSFDGDITLQNEVEHSIITIADLKDEVDTLRKKNISKGVKKYYSNKKKVKK